MTTRAVAERAEANLGLIHYHFGGLPALRRVIAHRAAEDVFGPSSEALLTSTSLRQALTRLRSIASDPPVSGRRVAVELIAGGVREPELGAVLRAELERVRGVAAEWLAAHAPQAPPGAATLLLAALDGLLLHSMLDPDLDVLAAVDALAVISTGDVHEHH